LAWRRNLQANLFANYWFYYNLSITLLDDFVGMTTLLGWYHVWMVCVGTLLLQLWTSCNGSNIVSCKIVAPLSCYTKSCSRFWHNHNFLVLSFHNFLMFSKMWVCIQASLHLIHISIVYNFYFMHLRVISFYNFMCNCNVSSSL
jgi:hypothetical protein